MPNPDPYIRKSSAVGTHLPPRGGTDKKRWRTSEDAKRVKEYDTFENLYLGNHNKKAGGPFKHPYGMKAVDEDIPYKIFNLLGKGSEAFANLVVGDGVFASSADENTQALLQILDFSLPLWEAMVRSSSLGFVGLQPMQITKNQIPVQIRKEIDISSLPDKLWNWGIVDPRFLYLEFGPVDKEIVKIRKALPFRNIKISKNKQIDILFEETHTKDRIETRLYQISGEFIEQELDLAIYKLIDPKAELVETWEHGLNNFFISLLINNKLETKILHDYRLF